MAEPGITVTRVFDASRERVWKEWVEPERFSDWFGGPEWKVPLSSVSMDVRPGGAWRLTMLLEPGRREIHWKGEYREVVEPERLVFTVTDKPGDDVFELITVVLTDLGDGRTEMLFEQRGVMSAEPYSEAEQGWGGFFDRIAAPGRRLIPHSYDRARGAAAAGLRVRVFVTRRDHVTPSNAASTFLSRSTSPRIPAAASLKRNASASFTIA
jgi:uncharacterized protein YndB with AHSA1/START domain